MASIIVPLLVAFLFFTTQGSKAPDWVHYLPLLNACINGTTALLLIVAIRQVKNGNKKLHQRLMTIAFVLGVVFLVSYVTYHALVPSTRYGDINHDGVLQVAEKQAAGALRTIYLGLLLSHILAAVAALPFILTAFTFALKQEFAKHRKWVRFAFPLWLYVAITGVAVYVMISPYY